MAIRRAKQRQQVIDKLSAQAPPGETFIACVHSESGPSPWFGILFDEVPLLGLVVQLMRRFYFLTLTNTSVVINTASRFTNRPGDIIASYPREGFPASGIKRGKLWSVMYVQFPNASKPTRLNIDRYWRSEFDQFVAVFPKQDLDPADPAA